MIQLEPREYFVICRQLDDPTDTAKYYVRAYIRNAKTDELLDTVDLEDMGEQRFRKAWQVPADTSGQGFYISITTKVFTDSNYTNESPNYGREENIYLVQKRFNPILGAGGSINYDKVREIVREEIQKIPKTEIPKMEKVDLRPLLKELKNIQKKISEIKIPEPEKVDFSGIERSLKEIKNRVAQIEIPETDLSGIENKLNLLEKKIMSFEKETNKSINIEFSRIEDKIKEFKDVLNGGVVLNIPNKMNGEFVKPKKTRKFI